MTALLEVTGLGKSFGGVAAVTDLDVRVEAGRIHSVIGPNGAGKTTLLNLVNGIYAPSAGRIAFDGHDITALGTAARARAGIARTFQTPQAFHDLTAAETVMVGRHVHVETGLLAALLHLPAVARANRAARAAAVDLLERFGLAEWADADTGAMPYGALKRLEIARALAAEPRLLLLDEPAAGLNPAETQAVAALIRAIGAAGVTVVLVEHDMKLVMDISDRILVLDYGRRLAEGTAAQVRADPAVIRAYLGAA